MDFRRLPFWAFVLLLLAFLGGKALEYHPATHGDGDAAGNCELCEFVLLAMETPFTTAEEGFAVAFEPVHSECQRPWAHVPRLSEQEVFTGRFCRPPPACCPV